MKTPPFTFHISRFTFHVSRFPFHVSRLPIAVFLLIAFFSMAYPAAAQSPITDDDVNAIAKDLFCPICESTPLDVCETQACADWREIIRTKLDQGQTEQDIRGYFEEQYGVRALSEPPQRGFTLALWIAPLVAMAIGAFFFSRYMRDLRRVPAPSAAVETGQTSEPPSDDSESTFSDYSARIERELEEID